MRSQENLMNSIWFGEKSNLTKAEIEDHILKSSTESEVLLKLIELFKSGDFTQKPLLIQLMNRTQNEDLLNLCIRVFFSVATHEDLKNPNHFHFLSRASEDIVNNFASAAITSLSLEVIPHLLALHEDWEEISDTVVIIRDSIDYIIGFEEEIGEEASLEEIGDYYFNYCQANDPEKYYFQQKWAFPGDLAKKMMERVMIAASNEEPLTMELIPSLLSVWTGEKVPGDYYTVINKSNYKDFISYINGLAKKNWEKGNKYFYGFKL
jgi:Immunity protein 47